MGDKICVNNSRSAEMLLHHEDSEWYQMIFRLFLVNTNGIIEDSLPKRAVSHTAVLNAPVLITIAPTPVQFESSPSQEPELDSNRTGTGASLVLIFMLLPLQLFISPS